MYEGVGSRILDVYGIQSVLQELCCEKCGGGPVHFKKDILVQEHSTLKWTSKVQMNSLPRPRRPKRIHDHLCNLAAAKGGIPFLGPTIAVSGLWSVITVKGHS